jgi:hypothetical protein
MGFDPPLPPFLRGENTLRLYRDTLRLYGDLSIIHGARMETQSTVTERR